MEYLLVLKKKLETEGLDLRGPREVNKEAKVASFS